ncbi:MAG: tetratricopeptide repeat protein [Saprospiraceae bacterium]|nr:tetratricopeptide repeat protein [Saprospiraceae bacterium]
MANKKKSSSPVKAVPSSGTTNDQPWYMNKKIASWMVFLVAFLVYANTLGHDYTQDDAIVIYDNEFTTQGLSGIPDILKYDTFRGFFKVEGKDKLVVGGRYRPLTLVMFALEWQIFGRNPFIGHLISVLLYGFTCVLLYWLLLTLFKDYKKQLPLGLFALGGALLFTVHPVHTEVVANIKGRDETMALMGSLGALLLLLKGIDGENVKLKGLAILVFFLALFSKENTITFLAIIPLSLWFFRKLTPGKALVATAPFLGAAIVFLLIRGSIIGWSLGEPPMELMNNPFVKLQGNGFVPFAFGEWLATIIFTLGKYLLLLIFPHPLTHDYYPRHVEIMQFSDWQVLLSLLVYIGLGVFAFLKIGKRNILAFSILYYLITLSIVSNLLFPVGTNMSERFLFMPSVALGIALPFLFVLLERKFQGKNWLLIGVAIIGLLFAGKTISRNFVWKDNYTLFTTDVHTSVRSAKLQNAVGGEMINAATKVQDPGRKTTLLQEAITHLDIALEIHPVYKNAWLLKGNALNYLKEYDKAIASYQQALAIDPDYPEAHNNLLITYRDAGRYFGEEKGDIPRALQYLSKAYEKDSTDFETIRLLGVANGIMRNHGEAIRYFTEAVKLQPENADLLFNLGSAYYNAGNAEEGLRWHTKARQLDPNAGQPK